MIEKLFEDADRCRLGARHQPATRAVVGLLFWEDSLRTRVGFETAAAHLGWSATVVLGPKHTEQMSSAESVHDAVRSIAGWCDVIGLRHADPNVVATIAAQVTTPLINCGNGRDEHPTQSLIDAYAMRTLFGHVDGLRVALVGDLHGMRAAHSLLVTLGQFQDMTVRAIAPHGLGSPARYVEAFVRGGNRYEATEALRLDDVDVVYIAGLPARTVVRVTDERRATLAIGPAELGQLQAHAKVLCPLPRIDEISGDVDTTPHAAYFTQSRLGLFMRMAILQWVRPLDQGIDPAEVAG